MIIALFYSVFCRYNQDCTPSGIMPLGPSGNTVYGYATYELFHTSINQKSMFFHPNAVEYTWVD